MVPGWTFDARQHTPRQSSTGGHPPGKFPFTITKVQSLPIAEEKGGRLCVTFTSPEGSIDKNYMIWHKEEGPAKRANDDLSWLCHAVGVYNLTGGGEQLLNARGSMEVGEQKQSQADKDAGKKLWMEIKNIWDINGNEPGTTTAPAGNAPPGTVGGAAPQQAASAPWANQAPAAAPVATSPPAGNSAPWQQGQAAPAAQPTWQTAPAAGSAPPWAQK